MSENVCNLETVLLLDPLLLLEVAGSALSAWGRELHHLVPKIHLQHQHPRPIKHTPIKKPALTLIPQIKRVQAPGRREQHGATGLMEGPRGGGRREEGSIPHMTRNQLSLRNLRQFELILQILDLNLALNLFLALRMPLL